MKALVTGATGLVGRALLRELTHAIVSTRDPAHAARRIGAVPAVAWQPELEIAPPAAFDGAGVVFHLAGEPVAQGRWTRERKARIRDSRILGTRNLVAGLAALPAPPPVLVCASAVGFYGNGGDAELRESSPKGEGFLADVVEAWENEARAAERHGVRVVMARFGIILARDGGALARMLTPFRLGLGGKLGDGRQWMPWVHIDDVVGLLLLAARDERLRGPVNVVSPEPVSNARFTRALGEALGRPTLLGVPRLALRAVFGELCEPLLESQRVVPGVAAALGYEFAFPHLAPALEACLRGAI